MRLLPAIAMTLVLALPAERVFCETQPNLPSPTFVLHIPSLRVAEMSPDEEYLAAIVVHWSNGVPLTAELQLWDFRQGTLLQTHSLPAPEARPEYPHGTTYLHYTSDGQLLAVYTGGDLLHVLRATDLQDVRTVAVQSHANINAFEVSPTGHRVAMCVSREIRVYDLDSGEEIQSWRINPHSEELDRPGLTWRADGGALAVSVADNPPCSRGGGTIYVFDPLSKQVSKTFRVPLLPASIAFGAVNSLYVASNICGGYFAHWTLDLPVFDSVSGRKTGKIPAGKVGIRNHIAISAGHILLAYADREKTTFEGFEDTLKIENAQWQVWDLSAARLIWTFPATGWESVENYPSLSSAGHFLCANRAQDLEIYAVPLAEK